MEGKALKFMPNLSMAGREGGRIWGCFWKHKPNTEEKCSSFFCQTFQLYLPVNSESFS